MKLFATENDAINWVATNIAFGVKPKREAKAKFVYPFTSHNALIQVVEHLGKQLYKYQEETFKNKV